jgi:hypothetical protein
LFSRLFQFALWENATDRFSTMAWRNRLAVVIFGIGATLSAVWGYHGVRGVLTGFDAGGGGIGAGVVGSSELLVNVLPVIITFWLSAQIRNRGRTEQAFRRLHLFATLALVAVLTLFVSEFFFQLFFRSHVFGRGMISWAIFIASFIAAVIWLPLQAFFAAGFLGLLIRGRTPIA